ncbi:MAG: adenylyl-sulfate kinase [Tatlockia sp.]|nr:adenylyl-sulfate kinase [Tatlockia sp.]
MPTFVVLVAGASGTGKSTFTKMLEKELLSRGISTYVIPMDNYYKKREPNTPETSDFDDPDSFDLKKMGEQLRAINNNETVELPQFCFKVKNRLEETIRFNPESVKVVILEGLHAFRGKSCFLPKEQTYSVYIELDEYLTNVKRRVKRDIPSASEGGRNTTEELTRERELTCNVRGAYFKDIASQKHDADVTVSNNDPNDFSIAVPKEADEIIARLQISPAKLNYSVAEIKRSDFWRPAPKRTEIETIEKELSVTELISKFEY